MSASAQWRSACSAEDDAQRPPRPEDLGISDTNFPEGQFTLATRHMRVQFTYTPINFSGDRTVTRTIVFNCRTYTLGTRVVRGPFVGAGFRF